MDVNRIGFLSFFLLCGIISPGKASDQTLTSSSGTFSSPSYPTPYEPNLTCTWLLVAPIGMSIELIFDVVDLQDQNGEGVCLDTIEVFDGPPGSSTLTFPFCGDGPIWPQHPIRFLSSSYQLSVTFKTDSIGNGMGFQARYTHVQPRTEYIAAIGVESTDIIQFTRFSARSIPRQPLEVSTRPSALTFDHISDFFYYTDTQEKFIARVHIGGSSSSDILITDAVDNPLGIAAAYLTGLLYWTDAGRDEVSVSRLDGSFRKTLVPSNSGCAFPKAIVLSLDHQHVFWSCSDRIEKCKADGSEREVFLDQLDNVKSLAIDPEGQTLYWVSSTGTSGVVEEISLDGSGRNVIFHEAFLAKIHDFVVDSFAFFWSVPSEKRIYHNVKDGTLDAIRLSDPSPSLEGLYYYKSDEVIPAQHQCAIDNGGCEELCLPDQNTFTCNQVTPVILNCSQDIVMFTTGPERVYWEDPTATSSSNGPVLMDLPYRSRSHNPGTLFIWGTTKVTYVFSDDFGNEAECSFNIILSEIITKDPPVISHCPEDIKKTTSGPLAVFWQEPTAVSSINGQTPVDVPFHVRSHKPGSTFSWGTTIVTYLFLDEGNNAAHCSFNVILSQLTTASSIEVETSTVSQSSSFDIDKLFTEYLVYTVISIAFIAVILLVVFITCIACCCGCLKCTSASRDDEHSVEQHNMGAMNYHDNGNYDYALYDKSVPPYTPR